MKEIKLGDRVVDVITGFKGIAYARTVYLCDSPGITVVGKNDNDKSETKNISEDRLAADSIKELQMLRGIIPMELKAVECPDEYKEVEGKKENTGTETKD